MNKIFNILLNLYFLISIPVYWELQRWSILQSNYFTFGILSLFILTFMLDKKRDLKNIWIGFGLLLSLISIFTHSYYISEFTKKFATFSLMSEGFIYLLCGSLLFKIIYEYGEKDLRKYPFLWIALSALLIKAFIDKSFSPICSLLVCFIIYLFKNKKYTIGYFMSLPIFVGILKYYNELWLNLQPRLWAWLVMIKEIIKYPLGKGFSNTINGNVIECDMFEKWGANWGAVSATDKGLLVFPHNDYLNITMNLGAVSLLIIIGLFIWIFKGVKFDLLAFGCLAILITAFFQTTFYFPSNAILYVPLFSLLGVRKNVETW